MERESEPLISAGAAPMPVNSLRPCPRCGGPLARWSPADGIDNVSCPLPSCGLVIWGGQILSPEAPDEELVEQETRALLLAANRRLAPYQRLFTPPEERRFGLIGIDRSLEAGDPAELDSEFDRPSSITIRFRGARTWTR